MKLPPSPKGSSVKHLYEWIFQPVQFLDRWATDDAITLKVPGGPPVVVLGNPQYVRDIFKENPPVFLSGKFNSGFKGIMGDRSLFVLDEDEHLRARKMIMPAFHGDQIFSYGEEMANMTRQFAKDLKPGEVISIFDTMRDLTLKMILRFIFGVEDGQFFFELKKSLEQELKVLSKWAWLNLEMFQLSWGPFSPWGKFLSAKRKADVLIYQAIQEKRNAQNSNDRGVLSQLISARDADGNTFTDKELRDQLMTLLIAGHETSATALAWAFRWILSDQDILQELKNEIQSLGGLDPKVIYKNELLDATVKEVLRLVPIVPGVGRVVKESVKVGPYELPQGVHVAPCMYWIQRSARQFSDPLSFYPKRFMEKDKAFSTSEYFPFGGGRRRCVGMSFAVFEMKMILATLLSSVDLELPKTQNLEPKRSGVTFIPASGTQVRVRKLI